MKSKDLNIFVCENIVFHIHDKPEVKLFAEKCKVIYNWFDNLDIDYQDISGFRLLINGPPIKDSVVSSLNSLLVFLTSLFPIFFKKNLSLGNRGVQII